MNEYPKRVKIVEVSPRDGLQNEARPIPTDAKAKFIQKLIDAGLLNIEVTSFVHPKFVPQLADASALWTKLPSDTDVTFSALVPNDKGLDRAIDAGVKRIAVFTAASESFSKKNINMTIDESLAVFAKVVSRALSQGMTVRGYLSTCFVCPYEGDVKKERVREVAAALLDMGVDEVSISDTIGAAAPNNITETVGYLLRSLPVERIALHFHDTYGTALANVCAGLALGVSTYDASVGDLGGCPFAPGASGNLATEDLIYMLERMGIETGVSIDRAIEAAGYITRELGRFPASKQWTRLRGGCDASKID